MESATIASKSLQLNSEDNVNNNHCSPMCMSQKRISDRNINMDDYDKVNCANGTQFIYTPSPQSKRFKGTAMHTPNINESFTESPKNPGKRIWPKRLRLEEVLSPITEISINLSDTKLNSPGATDLTPVKHWTKNLKHLDSRNFLNRPLIAIVNGNHEVMDQFKSNDSDFTHIENLETDSEQLQKKLTDDGYSAAAFKNKKTRKQAQGKKPSLYHMPRNASSLPRSRRLNMDMSIHEMSVDDLSLYDDGCHSNMLQSTQQDQQRLLSPEGSPQRFEIMQQQLALPTPLAAARLQKEKQKAAQINSNNHVNSNKITATPTAKTFRIFHSLSTGSTESSTDDDYMELYEIESMTDSSSLAFPSDLNSLISGQIVNRSPATVANNNTAIVKTPCAQNSFTPEMRRPSVRRCLSMTENFQQSPKTPELLKEVQETNNCRLIQATTVVTPNSGCFKRPEPPTSANCSPIVYKRYRSEVDKENLESSYNTLPASCPPTVAAHPAVCATITSNANVSARPQMLRKCMSMNDAEIMTALSRADNVEGPELIGDFSKPFVLPLMEGRHRDLKSISSDTVARLINGEFKETVGNYKIIDCRYPYEFDGGHIRGAKNLYTQEQIIEEFLTQQQTELQQANTEMNGCKRNIVIFHCEFSSERGPKLSRFLRNNDRLRNTNVYPALDYPEIYLLHDGYKNFFQTHSELCDPIDYRPMLAPGYTEAYRHFRAKSKSWNGDGLGGGTTKLKKSRSRLML